MAAVLVHLRQSFPLILQASKFLDIFLIQRLATLLDLFQFFSQCLNLCLNLLQGGVRPGLRQGFSEVGIDASAITSRIQSSQNALTIRSHPHSNVERCSFWSLLARFRTSGIS